MNSLAFLVRFAAVVSLAAAPVFAAPHENLHQAADQLRKAKATHQITDLEEARRRLKAAVNNKKKSAFRRDALKAVDSAIDALRTGNRIESDKQIDKALSAIDEGAGGKKKR